jgi:hypothetical protein
VGGGRVIYLSCSSTTILMIWYWLRPK